MPEDETQSTISEEQTQATQPTESETQATQEVESVESTETESVKDELPEDPNALKELIKKAREEAKAHQASYTKSRQELAEIKKAQEQATEQQKETEVKQVSETVQNNYRAVKTTLSEQKKTDLQQIEAEAERAGTITWYDGESYQVTPENKHIFREMVAEYYAGKNKDLEMAFEVANKQALTKEQQFVREKSDASFQKYIESKKDTFEKQPELLDAVEFLKKETVFNEALVNDFTNLFNTYYEKRQERERKAEKLKLENSGDLEKLTGVSKLPAAGVSVTPKNLTSEQALALSKKDPKAFAEYIRKL